MNGPAMAIVEMSFSVYKISLRIYGVILAFETIVESKTVFKGQNHTRLFNNIGLN
jgi:hypothetical protein